MQAKRKGGRKGHLGGVLGLLEVLLLVHVLHVVAHVVPRQRLLLRQVVRMRLCGQLMLQVCWMRQSQALHLHPKPL